MKITFARIEFGMVKIMQAEIEASRMNKTFA